MDPWSPVSGDVVVPPGFVALLKVVDDDGRPVKARVTRIIPPEKPGMGLGGWRDEAGPDDPD